MPTDIPGDFDAFISRVLHAVEYGNPSISVSDFRHHVLTLHRTKLKLADDTCARLLTDLQRVVNFSNECQGLINEILSLFVWHRLHRGLMWEKLPNADRYAPIHGQFSRMEATILRTAANTPVDSAVVNHMIGAIRCAFGRYAEAHELFRARAFPLGTYMKGFWDGAGSFGQIDAVLAAASDAPPRIDQFLNRTWETSTSSSGQDGSNTLVFSADDKYFNALALPMVESYVAAGGSSAIDIVVLARRESIEAVADSVIATLDTRGLSGRVTAAETDYDVRTMSAVARYLWARELVCSDERPCVILDIDILFSSASARQIDNLQNSGEIGLSHAVYGRSVMPWAVYLAGTTYISSSPAGRYFLDRYAWFIGRYMRSGQRQWFIDQNALFAADLLQTRFYPSARKGNTAPLLNELVSGLNHESVRQVKRSTLK